MQTPASLGFFWMVTDTWIIVIGALAAMACALVGVFLLLRKMSMMGDAISHAVLPGLAGGFLAVLLFRENAFVVEHLPWLSGWAQATDPRSPLVMLFGAALIGVLTALFTQWIHRFGAVDQGAAMGVVFTTLFALGLVLIVVATEHHAVDLDPGCVLYGAIELAPLDTVDWLGTPLPRAAIVIGGVLLINAFVIALLFKELRISSFDPQLSTTVGIPANAMHYLLMTLVAITTVACFEAIGSILVIAMLIVPAAAAHLLTDRLSTMLWTALGLGALSSVLGHLAAITVPTWFTFGDTTIDDMSSAGSMAVVAGLLLLLAIGFSPKRGLLQRHRNRWRLHRQIAQEDILAMLHRLSEIQEAQAIQAAPAIAAPGTAPSPHAAACLTPGDFAHALDRPHRLVRQALAALVQAGHLSAPAPGTPGSAGSAGSAPETKAAKQAFYPSALTQAGRTAAQQLVRSHRLWEAYLAQRLNLPLDRVHAPAEHLEHITTDALQQQLAQETGQPQTDPHGRPIPPPEATPSSE